MVCYYAKGFFVFVYTWRMHFKILVLYRKFENYILLLLGVAHNMLQNYSLFQFVFLLFFIFFIRVHSQTINIVAVVAVCFSVVDVTQFVVKSMTNEYIQFLPLQNINNVVKYLHTYFRRIISICFSIFPSFFFSTTMQKLFILNVVLTYRIYG